METLFGFLVMVKVVGTFCGVFILGAIVTEVMQNTKKGYKLMETVFGKEVMESITPKNNK